jgi:hypothetical protein
MSREPARVHQPVGLHPRADARPVQRAATLAVARRRGRRVSQDRRSRGHPMGRVPALMAVPADLGAASRRTPLGDRVRLLPIAARTRGPLSAATRPVPVLVRRVPRPLIAVHSHELPSVLAPRAEPIHVRLTLRPGTAVPIRGARSAGIPLVQARAPHVPRPLIAVHIRAALSAAHQIGPAPTLRATAVTQETRAVVRAAHRARSPARAAEVTREGATIRPLGVSVSMPRAVPHRVAAEARIARPSPRFRPTLTLRC